MASIQKRGKKYQVKWRNPDGSQRAKTVASKRVATELRNRAQDAEDRGVVLDLRPAADPRLYVGIAAAVKELQVSRKSRTVDGYVSVAGLFAVWLQRELGREPTVADLTKSALYGYHHHVAVVRRKSVAYANMSVTRLLKVWKILADHTDYAGIVARPPWALELPGIPGAGRVFAATWEELDSVIQLLSNPWHRKVACIARYTGLRSGQVVRLRREDFDVSGLLLTVRGELGKTRHERQGRVVPFSEHLLADAAWLPGRQPGPLFPPEEVLDTRMALAVQAFRRKNGSRTLPVSHLNVGTSFTNGMRRAWERSGLDQRLFARRPGHAFRIGFRTNLVASGADRFAIDFLLGHQSNGSTGDHRYTASWAVREEVVEAVALIPRLNPLGTGGEQG